MEISQADRSAEIGYWLAEPHNGRGHMTAACLALVDHGFDALRLYRAVIRAATGNAPSRAVAERLGFRLEGVEREAQLVKGEFVDLARLRGAQQRVAPHPAAHRRGDGAQPMTRDVNPALREH